MSIYKVTMEKVVFVRAENKEDAEELAIDEQAIMIEESLISVEKTTKRDMVTTLFDNLRKVDITKVENNEQLKAGGKEWTSIN